MQVEIDVTIKRDLSRHNCQDAAYKIRFTPGVSLHLARWHRVVLKIAALHLLLLSFTPSWAGTEYGEVHCYVFLAEGGIPKEEIVAEVGSAEMGRLEHGLILLSLEPG